MSFTLFNADNSVAQEVEDIAFTGESSGAIFKIERRIPMKLVVKVTAEDIEAGEPQCPTTCPLANALARTAELRVAGEVNDDIASIGRSGVRYVKDSRFFEAEHTPESLAFIVAVDRHGCRSVGPSVFTFDFEERTP